MIELKDILIVSYVIDLDSINLLSTKTSVKKTVETAKQNENMTLKSFSETCNILSAKSCLILRSYC